MLATAALCAPDANGCTSMVVGAKASASGRPMLWKNRDTGEQRNFLKRVEPADGGHAYVALFNAGDSLLTDAWMGMNDAGFAIMNTASYNLAPDTAAYADREGKVMAQALATCVTVEDFRALLEARPRPRGIQANFGVIDAYGGAVYIEANDNDFTVFNANTSPNHVLVRTNFSFTGNDTTGMGYCRYRNVERLLTDKLLTGSGFVPEDFTEVCSRSFYNEDERHDAAADPTLHLVADRGDYIPRHSTSASVVIEGVNAGETYDATRDMTMWTMMGYPPTAFVQAAWLDNIPAGLQPLLDGWRAADSEESIRLRDTEAFVRDGDTWMINLDYVRATEPEMRRRSAEGYQAGRTEQKRRIEDGTEK